MRWTVLIVRLPADPSRHRVAVWRELRRTGALMLGQGVWAVPTTPAFTQGLERAVRAAERGDGEVLLLDAAGRDEANTARLEGLFTAARQAEWAEFVSDCGKYEAELDKETRTAKFTLAEHERTDPAKLAPDRDPVAGRVGRQPHDQDRPPHAHSSSTYGLDCSQCYDPTGCG